MKVWKKILIVLLVLLAILAGLAFWQRDNLQALRDAAQYTPEELEEKLGENQQAMQDAVDAYPDIFVRPITEEERQALLDGTLTREELLDNLLGSLGGLTENGKVPGGQNGTNSGSSAAPSEPQKPADNAYQQELSGYVAEIYVLQAEYTGQLESMFAAAKAEYLALPEDQRTQSNKASIASKYLSMASGLEGQCDAKMDGIVSSMESLIRANNGDMSLVDTVVYTYANEKSLKKSWYMSQLN